MTAPVIFALHHGGTTERSFWTRCLVDHDIHEGDFQTARQYLLQQDAFSRAHQMAEEHHAAAQAALAPIPDQPLKNILHDLATFAVRRTR